MNKQYPPAGQRQELPNFLRELLANPPRAGAGVHNWLFRCARQLLAHFTTIEIFQLLKAAVQNCGRHVPDSEIWDAIKNSVECAWKPSGQSTTASAPQSKWPGLNQEQRAAIIRDGGGLADLSDVSPICVEGDESKTEEIIDRLFPGNPLLCCGVSNSQFDTKPRELWRGELSQLELIVPSPMTALRGKRKSDGKESAHTLDNTGPRRFLVCEFDHGPTDEHAALLLHLAEVAPLVCVVHSAGKSLHGWFYVHGQPDEKVAKFFRNAVSLGADHATWTRSQFVRMPDGTRDNGNRQTVFFLNYAPLEVSR